MGKQQKGNSAATLKHILIKLTSECNRLFEHTDLKESVQKVMKGGQEHVNTWNRLMRESVWGMNKQKDIIMKSQDVQDVNKSVVVNAMSKMMDSVRSAKNMQSLYMRQMRECSEKCRYIIRTTQEAIDRSRRNKTDLERKIKTLEENIKTLVIEATEFETLADRLSDRARELDGISWFTKLLEHFVLIGPLALTAGFIFAAGVAYELLGKFNLKTALGCRDGARECRQKATEKRNEIVSLRSNVQAHAGEVTKLQDLIDRVTADIDTIHGIERELNNLMQGIELLNIQKSCDHVLGLLQSCADRLTFFEADSQLQNLKVEWNTMERQLTQCSMPFSDFIF